MTAQQGIIIPMPPQVVDPAVKETLGAKISALVQSYNDMKSALKDQPQATKVQFDQLLEKRRAAVEAILAQHKSTLDEILGVGHTAKLAGIGAFETNEIQSQLTAQQTKMTALQTYFEAYKTAIAAGTQPPALPAELQEGSFGISATTLAILAALGAAAYFWWNKGE